MIFGEERTVGHLIVDLCWAERQNALPFAIRTARSILLAVRPFERHATEGGRAGVGCPFFFSKGQGKGIEKEEKWRNFLLLTGIEPGPSACDAIFLPTTPLRCYISLLKDENLYMSERQASRSPFERPVLGRLPFGRSPFGPTQEKCALCKLHFFTHNA